MSWTLTCPSSLSKNLSSDLRNTLVAKTEQIAVVLSAEMPRSLVPSSGMRSYNAGPYRGRRTLCGPGGLKLVSCLPLTHNLCLELDAELLAVCWASKPGTLKDIAIPAFGLVSPKLYGPVGESSWPLEVGGRTLLKYWPAALFTGSPLALQVPQLTSLPCIWETPGSLNDLWDYVKL